MPGDNLFAAPARRTGGQVGLAVAVLVEGFHDLGTFEIVQGLDVEFLHGFFGHQVTLQTTGLDHIAVFVGLVVKVLGQLVIVHGEPTIGPVVQITQGYGLIEDRVRQGLWVF